MNNTLITVFTPAYNRAHTITRTYESLCNQSNKNFIWLIIDDGSSDNTAELIKDFQSEDNGFEIIYEYKENGGMHTAHNVAYSMINTPLNVCIDSDDKLADNAIQLIYDVWDKIKDENYAGIIGLDADFNNEIIGTSFKKEGEGITLSEFYESGGRGDKKLVYKTDIINKYPPYPEYKEERLVPLSYKYIMCDQDYKLYPINEVICNVEYQLDGSTNSMWGQYLKSPKGFADFRRLRMSCSNSKKRLFTDAVHYVSSSIISKNKKFVKDSPKKLVTILAIPFGIALYFYIKRKACK